MLFDIINVVLNIISVCGREDRYFFSIYEVKVPFYVITLLRFLREFAQSLGYPSTFTIYDTSDSVSAIKTCLKELQLDDNVYKPKDVLSRISMAKNKLVTPAAYRRNTTAIQNDAVV